MSERPNIVPVGQIPQLGVVAHELMSEKKLHGTVSALVGAPRPGLKNREQTRAAIARG